MSSPEVGRKVDDTAVVARAFTRREIRQQRRSDGSICIAGRPFAVPARYRHLDQVVVRYATWDLDAVYLTHPDTDAILERLLPVDPEANASGARRQIDPEPPSSASCGGSPPRLPPLLQAALDQERASGLPPAFVSLEDDRAWHQEPPHAAS